MLNNFRNLNSLFWSQGSQWLLFRVAYALRKRMGILRKQMPSYAWNERPLVTWLKPDIPSTAAGYFEWRKQHSPKFFFDSVALPDTVPWDRHIAVQDADRILAGELQYFSHTWHRTGFPPNWHQDPSTGVQPHANKHWSELSDDSEVDIKFIWEASRFAMVYTLVRAYASSRDEKYADAFWQLIQSWAESNPPNTGPNWMDGQEAALRLMAWTFGFYAFIESPSTTPERVAQFVCMVAAHAERIHKNVDFAISTQSNHAVSEAFGLWMTGLLFPELKDAKTYFEFGKQLLEQQATAQIFPDGTYSMYALNYHRFILHMYLYATRLGELNHVPLSTPLQNRITSSIEYLSQLIDPATGQMPVYGSNDGALVLPLNNCDYTDYRPLLQLGTYITKGQALFDPGAWDEDIYWLFGSQLRTPIPSTPKTSSFPHGGTYILRRPNSKAVLRCTKYQARPSHADQLHLDLWMHGHNIAVDAGTYLYSGGGIWRNGLARTCVHNTVIVDHRDQMDMLTRFTWTNWSRGTVLQHDENIWQGEHDGYKRLPDPVTHKRTVKALGEDRWLVVDHLNAKQSHHYSLHWLLQDCPYQEKDDSLLLSLGSINCKTQFGISNAHGSFSIVRADPHSTRGWRSRYYGEKEPALSLMLETDQAQAIFWSFFGFEDDVLELHENLLKINSHEINLAQLNK